MIMGIGLVVAGLVLWAGGLSWFGRLPGNLRWETDRARLYFPIGSLVVVSLVLSVLAWIFRQR